MSHLRSGILALLGALVFTAPVAAQDGASLAGQCAAASGAARPFCGRVAEAIQVLEPRIAIALSGGNPVPGTASTLGMRLGTLPRISGALRASAAWVEVGGIENVADEDDMSFAVPSLNLDASVGIFSGLTVAPTIGGLGSLDLLASLGRIPLPEGEGFSGAVTSWAGGARVGILRESFTAPGVSLSAMYRSIGGVEYGDSERTARDAYFRLDDMSGWALRAAASKRLLGFGLTGGVGYDRYAAGVEASGRDPGAAGGSFQLREDDLVATRTTVFGNASFTLLVLHLVGEIGWQRGGDRDPALTSDRLEKAGLYGGLALRISL